jgi:hypothetical protein
MWRRLTPVLSLLFLAAAAFAGGYLLTAGSRAWKGASAPRPSEEPRETRREESSGAFRIRLMEEVSTGGDIRKEELAPPPERREERGGTSIVRRDRRKALLMILLDASRGAGAGGRAPWIREGVEGFLSQLPPGIEVGIRTMGGEDEGTCRSSRLLQPPAGEVPSLAGMESDGPRNLSLAMFLAAGDMAVRRGNKGVVLVTTGGEECGEWPCETAGALQRTADHLTTWVVAAGETPGADELLECIGREGRGGLRRVASAQELAGALTRVAAELSANLTVHYLGRTGGELQGRSDPLMSPWRVTAVPLAGGETVEGSHLPARFNLRPGRYDLTGWYGDSLASLGDLALAPTEEVEVWFAFSAAQLLLVDGSRGWEGEGECLPQVTVSSVDDPSRRYERCGLPSRLSLPPGTYLVAVAGKGQEQSATVTVEAGEPATVTLFADRPPEVAARTEMALDKPGPEN